MLGHCPAGWHRALQCSRRVVGCSPPNDWDCAWACACAWEPEPPHPPPESRQPVQQEQQQQQRKRDWSVIGGVLCLHLKVCHGLARLHRVGALLQLLAGSPPSDWDCAWACACAWLPDQPPHCKRLRLLVSGSAGRQEITNKAVSYDVGSPALPLPDGRLGTSRTYPQPWACECMKDDHNATH